MADNSVIMITGVSNYWGTRLAESLSQVSSGHIIGIDDQEPETDLLGIDLIKSELSNPLVGELLAREKVNTIVHLKIFDLLKSGGQPKGNVAGDTNQLSIWCAEAGVDSLIIPSSTAVYGAAAENSAFIGEESAVCGSHSHQLLKELADIELFSSQLPSEFPAPGLTILRFANIVGPTSDTPMTRYLGQDRPFVLLGYDPVLQFIHEIDVIDLLLQVVLDPAAGKYNIGADGAMPLTRVMRLVKKSPVPLLRHFAYKRMPSRICSNLKHHKSQLFGWDYLRYPWVGDLKKMKDDLGFYPRFTAGEALLDLIGELPPTDSTEDPLNTSNSTS